MKYLNIFSVVLVILAGWSCTPTRKTPQAANIPASAADYIEIYRDLAISEMKRTGIPASITLAQGIIESDMGRSRLAREGNNHFGIKCHSTWKGPVVKHDDDRRNECFRKYRTAAESYRDHSDFLVNTPRYSFLFDLAPDDYRGWARGLKKAGYATNPDYANMLIRKIEEYGLDKYDSRRYVQNDAETNRTSRDKTDTVVKPVVIQNESDTDAVVTSPGSGSRVMDVNRVKYIIVGEGDTRETIENKHKLLSWELSKYNELPDDFEPQAGQRLYLQPKRDRADVGNETHTVKEGETMYSISQLYAVKKSKLYLYNRMSEGEEPKPGARIWLRGIRPVN